MNKKLVAMLMGTALILAACGGNDNESTSDTASAGDAETLYNQKCSTCHGANLEGGVGPSLSSIGSELTKEEIEDIIKNGKGSMPSKVLEGDQAAAVAEWLAEKK